jgi:uncharacterized UBP type Zn finger protein
MGERCEHFAGIAPVAPRTRGCEECMAIGATWTQLRVCLSCGHVGCCEDSPHAHALAHFNATAHPLIVPLERKGRWSWCYVHHRYFDALPGALTKPPTLAARVLARLRRR